MPCNSNNHSQELRNKRPVTTLSPHSHLPDPRLAIFIQTGIDLGQTQLTCVRLSINWKMNFNEVQNFLLLPMKTFRNYVQGCIGFMKAYFICNHMNVQNISFRTTSCSSVLSKLQNPSVADRFLCIYSNVTRI